MHAYGCFKLVVRWNKRIAFVTYGVYRDLVSYIPRLV